MKAGKTSKKVSLLSVLVLASVAAGFAAEIGDSQLSLAVKVSVDFNHDIQPILETSCLRCHGGEKPKGRFRLDDRAAVLNGGRNNPDDMVPGHSDRSKLISYVARLIEGMEMPPPDEGEPLTARQISLLRVWIDQGANWGATNPPSEYVFSVAPTLRWIGVDGNKQKFREIEGVKEGVGGGWQQFNFRENFTRDKSLSVEGRALFPEQDLQIKLALEKNDFGFVRAGFDVWRKYDDDTGGFAVLLPTNSFALNRDLYLDMGRAWIDFGLTMPDWPQIVLGYEYQFKQGNEATLQWGPVGTQPPFTPGTDAKNVFPAFKHVDEHTHILKLDVTADLSGWQLADAARGEFYQLATRRQNALTDTFGSTPDTVLRINEHDSHIQGANTLSASKQFKDWLAVSGGYLYSRLEGDAAFQQNTLNGAGTYTGGSQWFANRILLEREAHVVSLANLIGPWSGLMLSLAVQGEWTRQETAGNEDLQFGDPSIPALQSAPTTIASHLNTASARENFSLRYTKLPYTVVYAETRLEQESLGRFEQRPDGSLPFLSDIAATIDSAEYRAGFNASPWQRVSLGAGFKHKSKQTEYTHAELFDPNFYSYPGFLRWRDIDDNQIETRLVLRFTAWLRTTFSYRFQETDFNNATAGISGLTPGGNIEAAKQRADVYSFNAGLTPFRRLYLSETFSFSDSRTATAQNGADYLVPYQGHVISLMSSATFTLNLKTAFNVSYVFSTADYGQNNQATGLPAGIDYERHELRFGVTHQFAKNLVTSLTYGFSRYLEPSLGGADDFTAQMIFGAVTIPWP